MTTQHVFIVGSSLEEDRPQIDFELSENSGCVDWLRMGEILEGTLCVDQYEPPQLIVHNPDATDWDFYRCAGTFGIMSEKASVVLGPLGKDCFDFLPATINDQSYYLLRQVGSIDVLDKENTVGKVFPHDPTRFMRISKYVFNKSKLVDPCIFTVPDTRSRFFGTDSIRDIIHRNNLRGFRLVDSESELG